MTTTPDAMLIISNRHAKEGLSHFHHLKERFLGETVDHVQTESKAEVARRVSRIMDDYRRPWIVSVGGDGSYNLVITSVMAVRHRFPDCQPIVAALPGGSANDHVKAVFDRTIRGMIRLLERGKTQALDIIRVSLVANGQPHTLFAHSYVSLGFTAEVAERFNQRKLHLPGEVMTSLQGLCASQPFSLDQAGELATYQHWSVHNVQIMARYFKAPAACLNNGSFELRTIPYEPHWNRVRTLWLSGKSMVERWPTETIHQPLQFKVKEPVAIQWDGETRYSDDTGPLILPAGTSVTITCLEHELETLAA